MLNESIECLRSNTTRTNTHFGMSIRTPEYRGALYYIIIHGII